MAGGSAAAGTAAATGWSGASCALGQAVAQQLLLNLARLGPRKLVDEVDAARHLEPGQERTAASLDLRSVGLGAVPYDGDLDHLTEDRMRYCEGRGLPDAVDPVDHLLDLPGEHVLATDIDHVFPAPDHVHAPRIVQ